MGLREAWLTAINELESVSDPTALTIPELMVLWECKERLARNRALRLVQIGRAQKVFKRLPGQRLVPAYRLVPNKT